MSESIITTGPEILIPKKNIILDSQILSTLMSCGRLTDFRFNLNLRALRGKSESLEMGSIAHKILEVYLKNIIKGFNRKLAIEHGMLAGLEYARNPEEVKNTSPEQIQWVFTTMEQYFEYYKNDHWNPLEVEVVKGRKLYEDDEIRILYKAKFDEIVDSNQGIFPVDHKTMKQRRDTISLNNQFKGQCILAEVRTVFVNKIGFQTSLKPEEKFQRVPVSYTYDRLAEWQGEILPYWAKMMLLYDESGYWPPNFTHCENKYGFCEFRHVCEADRSMREETLQQHFYIGEPWDITNDKTQGTD